MIKYIGQDKVDRSIFSVRFKPGCCACFPWGDEPFDCTVLTFDASSLRDQSVALCEFLVNANTGWINTAGQAAQWLHDEIDVASVARGRQESVGDGSPMTAWDDESSDPPQMVESALMLGDGNDNVLVIIIGSDADHALVETTIRSCLT